MNGRGRSEYLAIHGRASVSDCDIGHDNRASFDQFSARHRFHREKEMSDCDFENGKPVASEWFDHNALDSQEDIMREKLDQGMGALEICEAYSMQRAKEIALEQVRAFLALIAVEKRPLYFIDQLVWLSGLASSNGLSLPLLAKKHGVSKQAFEQAADRTNRYFSFPKTSAQRSEEAKGNMREAYQLNHE